jgi:hypothetical protein
MTTKVEANALAALHELADGMKQALASPLLDDEGRTLVSGALWDVEHLLIPAALGKEPVGKEQLRRLTVVLLTVNRAAANIAWLLDPSLSSLLPRPAERPGRTEPEDEVLQWAREKSTAENLGKALEDIGQRGAVDLADKIREYRARRATREAQP